MMKRLITFDIVDDFKDERGAYTHRVKWNPPAGTGFILQYVEVEDPLKLLSNYDGPYYEAWNVTDGKTDYEGFDDSFSNDGDGLLSDIAIGSVQRKLTKDTGYIEYRTKIYWISIDDPVYKEIEQWDHEVSMANELRSSYKAPVGPIVQDNEHPFRVDFIKCTNPDSD